MIDIICTDSGFTFQSGWIMKWRKICQRLQHTDIYIPVWLDYEAEAFNKKISDYRIYIPVWLDYEDILFF